MCSNAVSYTNLSPMFVTPHIDQSPVCAVPASDLLAVDFGIQTVHDGERARESEKASSSRQV